MPSWITRASESPGLRVGTTILLTSAVTATVLLAYQQLRRQERIDDLKSSIPAIDRHHHAEKLTDYGAATPQGWTPEEAKSSALAARALQGDYDEDLIREQLTRTSSFLTPEGLSILRKARVIVIGLGGVGSHAAMHLARSGVGHIRLVDFDYVSLSSLNRHAVATLADVGTAKTHCMEKHIRAIAPWVDLDLRTELFGAESAQVLLGSWTQDERKSHMSGSDLGLPREAPTEPAPIDFVIDAIDNIDSKVALLQACHERGLRVISSMGAGCKSDPTRVLIGDISHSIEDPLSRSVRRRLRMQGVGQGIPVVYSTEKPGEGKATLLPLAEEEFAKGPVGELGVLADFRVRILPVLGTLPAVFGAAAANYVLLTLARHPIAYSAPKARDKMYEGIYAALLGSEERIARAYVSAAAEHARESSGGGDAAPPSSSSPNPETADIAVGLKLALSVADMGFLVDEIYRGRSVVSGVGTRLVACRWLKPVACEGSSSSYLSSSSSPSQPSPSSSSSTTFPPSIHISPTGRVSTARLSDLVVMTKEEAARHERDVLLGSRAPADVYAAEVLERVERRGREVRAAERWRC